MKIMIADDEESIRKVVEHIVVKAGHEFCYAATGPEAMNIFRAEIPDVVILDVMMPDVNGFDICASIREESKVPIIFLSAKGDIVDKSIGFKMGADDYITKPFSSTELLLRIEAQIRRAQDINQNQGRMQEKKAVITFGEGWEISLNEYEIKKNGELVEFTSKEFAILAFMAQNQGVVFSREQLLDKIWGENYIGDINTITVFIRKIRGKIEEDAAHPRFLLTVWGVGYKFHI